MLTVKKTRLWRSMKTGLQRAPLVMPLVLAENLHAHVQLAQARVQTHCLCIAVQVILASSQK